MENGFACFDGTEIWNICRTATYLRDLMPQHGFTLEVMAGTANCCGCCDANYWSPALDDAPWVSDDHPESVDFYGFLPTEIDGLTVNPASRTVNAGITGAVIGARNEAGRTIEVAGVLWGASCAALEYGRAWFSASLEAHRGRLGQLMYQSCCPPDHNNCDSDGNPIATGMRFIPEVGMSSPLTCTPYAPETLQGLASRAEFTLSAAQSWIYDYPVEIASEVVSGGPFLPDPDVGFEIPPPQGVNWAVAEYKSTCVDGAALEVFVDGARNVGWSDQVTILAANSRGLPPLESPPLQGGILTLANATHGAVATMRPGNSVLLDPRRQGIWTVGPTGAITQPAKLVKLPQNSRGLFPVAYYGETWRVCVYVPYNNSGTVSVTVRAYPRRRI